MCCELAASYSCGKVHSWRSWHLSCVGEGWLRFCHVDGLKESHGKIKDLARCKFRAARGQTCVRFGFRFLGSVSCILTG